MTKKSEIANATALDTKLLVEPVQPKEIKLEERFRDLLTAAGATAVVSIKKAFPDLLVNLRINDWGDIYMEIDIRVPGMSLRYEEYSEAMRVYRMAKAEYEKRLLEEGRAPIIEV